MTSLGPKTIPAKEQTDLRLSVPVFIWQLFIMVRVHVTIYEQFS